MKKINNELKLVNPLLMWLIVILGVILIFYFLPSTKLFSTNYFTFILGAVFATYWIFFLSWSIKFHKNAPLSTFKINRIVKDGPYRIVRHPIYYAYIILGFGIFLFFPSLRVLFSLLWLIIVLSFWMKLEEQSLVKKFGLEYINYMIKTPMFIPNFKMKGGKR